MSWGMMYIAKLKCPRRDTTSCLVLLEEKTKHAMMVIKRSSFSLGIEVKFCVSRIMLYNSSEWAGPLVFSSERDTRDTIFFKNFVNYVTTGSGGSLKAL